jgi:hypothetical protein
MEVNRVRIQRPLTLPLIAAAILTFFITAAPAAARPSFQLTLGASGFLPSQALLREVYGDVLLGLQARASWRFAGGFTAFAGYRSVRADGAAKVLGPAFDSGSNEVRLDLSSFRGGFGFEWTAGRWTFGAQAGAAVLRCRETWPEAGLETERTYIGLIFAGAADVAVWGPLGLFARLELGPTQRKDDILLGGFDSEAGLSIRF